MKQNQNLNSPIHILKTIQNPEIKDYIFSSLKSSYGQYMISSDVVSYIINMLYNNIDTILFNDNERQTIIESIRHNVNQQANYQQIYENYKVNCKSAIHYQMISSVISDTEKKKHSKNIQIIDLGCGNNALAHFISTQRPEATIIGTDLLPYQTKQSSRVQFIQQKKPSVIPIDTNSCDIICLMSVLHHIATEDLTSFMVEIKRILKPNGTIIILEDSYSETTQPFYENKPLWEKFNAIEASQRKNAMGIIDWIACVLAPGDINMNLPYCFKTINEWENVFQQFNLSIIKVDFIGFIPKRFHFSPQTLFILENPAAI